MHLRFMKSSLVQAFLFLVIPSSTFSFRFTVIAAPWA
jgi:hypothetical protein